MKKMTLLLAPLLLLALWGTAAYPAYTAANGTALFVETADKTFSSSGAETSLLGTGIGTKTIPAGSMQVGDVYTIQIWGPFLSTSGDNFTVRAKLNSTTILNTGAGGLTSVTSPDRRGVIVVVNFTVITTGATGTVFAQGYWLNYNASATMPVGGQTPKTATVTVDTTIDQTLDVTGQFNVGRSTNVWTTTNAWILRNTQ